jgi:enterochelin esterase-like enzyme
VDESRYYKRTIIKEQINSHSLQEARNVRVFLPPGYNELLTYPILYCQDGEDFFNFGRVATHMTRLILDEGAEPVIIAGVEVDKAVRTSEYDARGQRFRGYCHFFVEELLPFIEDRYPVRGDVTGRVLAGDSLGGSVSFHLMLDHPHLFRQVIALSGAFFPVTQQRIEQETDLSWLDAYLTIGLDESAVQTERGVFDFLSMNRITQALLQERKAKLVYQEKPGGHVWGFWQNELPDALRHFFG